MKKLTIEIHDEHWLTLLRLAQAHDVTPESHISALVSVAMAFPPGGLDSPMLVMALLGSTRDPAAVVKNAKQAADKAMQESGVRLSCCGRFSHDGHSEDCPQNH